MTPEEIIVDQIKKQDVETAKQLLKAYVHDMITKAEKSK